MKALILSLTILLGAHTTARAENTPDETTCNEAKMLFLQQLQNIYWIRHGTHQPEAKQKELWIYFQKTRVPNLRANESVAEVAVKLEKSARALEEILLAERRQIAAQMSRVNAKEKMAQEELESTRAQNAESAADTLATVAAPAPTTTYVDRNLAVLKNAFLKNVSTCEYFSARNKKMRSGDLKSALGDKRAGVRLQTAGSVPIPAMTAKAAAATTTSQPAAESTVQTVVITSGGGIHYERAATSLHEPQTTPASAAAPRSNEIIRSTTVIPDSAARYHYVPAATAPAQ
ncbi:MAG: hypothetical protein AB7N80_12675 [Bdellovibrionales bacterium]